MSADSRVRRGVQVWHEAERFLELYLDASFLRGDAESREMETVRVLNRSEAINRQLRDFLLELEWAVEKYGTEQRCPSCYAAKKNGHAFFCDFRSFAESRRG